MDREVQAMGEAYAALSSIPTVRGRAAALDWLEHRVRADLAELAARERDAKAREAAGPEGSE